LAAWASAVLAGDVILPVQHVISPPKQTLDSFSAARAEKRESVLVLVQPEPDDKTGIKWMALRVTDD
jgi:hypothetical protein